MVSHSLPPASRWDLPFQVQSIPMFFFRSVTRTGITWWVDSLNYQLHSFFLFSWIRTFIDILEHQNFLNIANVLSPCSISTNPSSFQYRSSCNSYSLSCRDGSRSSRSRIHSTRLVIGLLQSLLVVIHFTHVWYSRERNPIHDRLVGG